MREARIKMSSPSSLSFPRKRESMIVQYQKTKNPILFNQIIQDYTPLLYSVARKYHSDSFEDILQTGYLGLINAINRYRQKPDVKFSTYAACLIEGEIKHYLRDKVLIKEPRWARRINKDINEAVSRLTARYGRLPTVSEISDELNIEEDGILEVLRIRAGLKIASLEENYNENDSDTEEVIHIEKVKSKEYETLHIPIEDQITLEQAMEKLSDIQKKVIQYLFYKDLSQTEAANILGTTQRNVSRVLSSALTNLREVLEKEIW